MTAQVAAIHNQFIRLWFKEKTNPTLLALISSIHQTRMIMSWCECPITKPVPGHLIPHIPKHTIYGQMLHAQQYTGMWPECGDPLTPLIQVIYNQFPSGYGHLWSQGLTDQQGNPIHYPNLIRAGIHYLSDICTEAGGWMSLEDFPDRHPIDRDEYNTLITSLTTMGWAPMAITPQVYAQCDIRYSADQWVPTLDDINALPCHTTTIPQFDQITSRMIGCTDAHSVPNPHHQHMSKVPQDIKAACTKDDCQQVKVGTQYTDIIPRPSDKPMDQELSSSVAEAMVGADGFTPDLFISTDGSGRFVGEEGQPGYHSCASAIFHHPHSDHNRAIRLEGNWTSYGAELLPIYIFLRDMDPSDKNILIMSDCLSAIKAITHLPNRTAAKHYKVCFAHLLMEIAGLILEHQNRGGQVHFFKVKSHEGVIPNVVPDCIAYEAADRDCPYSTSFEPEDLNLKYTPIIYRNQTGALHRKLTPAIKIKGHG